MNIGRKIYYDKTTGNVIYDTGEVSYGIAFTIEEDVATYTVLSERNRETFDVTELEYGAYTSDFREGQLVGINLETREPIFAYPNPEEPSAPIIVDKPLTTQISELKEELSSAQTVLDFLLMGGM